MASCKDCLSVDVCKTVFLTREEAERALNSTEKSDS